MTTATKKIKRVKKVYVVIQNGTYKDSFLVDPYTTEIQVHHEIDWRYPHYKVDKIETIPFQAYGKTYNQYHVIVSRRDPRPESIKHSAIGCTNDDLFSVTNEIDDSEQELSESELYTDSMIGEAINNKAFFMYS